MDAETTAYAKMLTEMQSFVVSRYPSLSVRSIEPRSGGNALRFHSQLADISTDDLKEGIFSVFGIHVRCNVGIHEHQAQEIVLLVPHKHRVKWRCREQFSAANLCIMGNAIITAIGVLGVGAWVIHALLA